MYSCLTGFINKLSCFLCSSCFKFDVHVLMATFIYVTCNFHPSREMLFIASRPLADLWLMFCPLPFIICWLVGWLVGLGPKFLDSGSQLSLNGSPRNLHTSLLWGQVLLLTFENFSPTSLPIKKLVEKNLKIAYPTFIHRIGVPKRIEGSQFQFNNIK